uniref:Protein kinase domain-containing protein n=1 Tax=Plectus sambesii TaxID=2011161 RepID=A0A914V9R7_9BILA
MNGRTLETFGSCVKYDTISLNPRYQIPKDNIERDKKAALLGEGFYGVVYAAKLKDENGRKIKVAVKEAKKNKSIQVKAIQDEITLLADIGEHEYILQLIGAVTTDAANICMITEFCEFGSLDNFLKKKKETKQFISEIISTAYDNDWTSTYTDPTRYKAKSEPGWSAAYNSRQALGQVTTSDLLAFGYQIASGMIYLHEKNIIHRDLALRNILLKSNFKIKIADFGLSRATSNGVYVPSDRGVYLPNSTAPDGIISLKSDWWMFGVLIWELFELGDNQPFKNMNTINRKKFLEGGRRLEHPIYAPREM